MVGAEALAQGLAGKYGFGHYVFPGSALVECHGMRHVTGCLPGP